MAIRLRLGLVNDQYVRPNVVAGLLGVHRTTLWRWVREGTFPEPVKLGPRVTAWRLKDVREYMRERADAGSKS